MDTLDLPQADQRVEANIRFAANVKLAKPHEVDLEIEYGEQRFMIEPGVVLEAFNPLKLGYHNDKGTLEVIGWDIQVPLGEGRSLADVIAKKFLDFYSKSQHGGLTEVEAFRFSEMCAQVDYRGFCAARRMPHWQEAWLVRKQPHYFLNFGSDKLIKVDGETSSALRLLDVGTYFGAWFTIDRDGSITRIQHPEALPQPSSIDLSDLPPATNIEFDPALESMLPDPTDWKRQG